MDTVVVVGVLSAVPQKLLGMVVCAAARRVAPTPPASSSTPDRVKPTERTAGRLGRLRVGRRVIVVCASLWVAGGAGRGGAHPRVIDLSSRFESSPKGVQCFSHTLVVCHQSTPYSGLCFATRDQNPTTSDRPRRLTRPAISWRHNRAVLALHLQVTRRILSLPLDQPTVALHPQGDVFICPALPCPAMPTLGPSAISGACAGLVSSIITCPLDVVKTKLQAQSSVRSSQAPSASAQQPPRPPEAALVSEARRVGAASGADQGQRVYKGLIGTLRTIYKDDGIRGFYRGLGPTIFGYLPTWAIYFTVYDGCKEFLASRGGTRERGDEDFINHVVSAMTAGGASTVCTSPLWVVKTRFMLQSGRPKDPSSPRPYKHTLDAFVQIMRTEGPAGFYRGLLPSLMGVSHVAVQFPLYENFKGWARSASGSDELQPKVILLCSSSAKMIASVLTYPHEVVRTRLQMQPRAKASSPVAPTSSSPAPSVDSRRGFTTMTRSLYPPGKSIQGPLSSFLKTSSSISASQQQQQPQQQQQQQRRHASASTAESIASPQKYSGLIRTIKTIFVEEGVRGFYNGMGVNLIRTVPSSALTILTYEVMMGRLTGTGATTGGNKASSSPSQQQQQSETESG